MQSARHSLMVLARTEERRTSWSSKSSPPFATGHQV